MRIWSKQRLQVTSLNHVHFARVLHFPDECQLIQRGVESLACLGGIQASIESCLEARTKVNPPSDYAVMRMVFTAQKEFFCTFDVKHYHNQYSSFFRSFLLLSYKQPSMIGYLYKRVGCSKDYQSPEDHEEASASAKSIIKQWTMGNELHTPENSF